MAASDYLLPQVEMTLNLLCCSAICPNVSAWPSLNGTFDFDHTSIAPAGMKIVSLEASNVRGTFKPNGVDGYYVTPALRHHRCYV